MVRALVLNAEKEAELLTAVASARADPIPWKELRKGLTRKQASMVTTLEDRPKDFQRPMGNIIRVDLDVGIEVAISFEEQPAGLMAHVSISDHGRPPHPLVAQMILNATKLENAKIPLDHGRVWVEEYVDGDNVGMAVNFCWVVEPYAGPTIHILHNGFPLCGFSRDEPRNWPDGHKWVAIGEADEASCTGCVLKLSEIEDEAEARRGHGIDTTH